MIAGLAALAHFPLVMAQIAAAPLTRDGYVKATGAGFGWLREVQMVLGEDGLPAQSEAILEAIFGLVRRSFDAAVRRCRSGGFAAVEDIVFFARQSQLMGFKEGELDAGGEAAKCVVFTVEIDSATRLDSTIPSATAAEHTSRRSAFAPRRPPSYGRLRAR